MRYQKNKWNKNRKRKQTEDKQSRAVTVKIKKKLEFCLFFCFQRQSAAIQSCKMGWKLGVLVVLSAKFLIPNLTAPSSSMVQLSHPPSPLHLLQISIFLFFFSQPRLQPRAGNKRNYLVSPHFSSSAWGLIKAKRKTQRSSTGFWYRPTTRGRERGKMGGKKNT